MKAIRITEFGGPEVLKVVETEKPTPNADEILIKVYASGVNPADWAIREGGNEILKPLLNLPLTLGWDAAGKVVAVGDEVTDFKIGDEVYGVPNFPGDGSYAEYCAAKASQFAAKPKTLSFNEASGVPLTALTAWTGIFENGNIKAGQRLLIHGAAGAVGSFALQFAKWKGAYVIATASAKNLDYLKSIGADEVIDYNAEDFSKVASNVDIIFDASPLRDNQHRLKSVNILNEGGTFVSVNADFPFSDEINEALINKKAEGKIVFAQSRKEWLEETASLIDAGKVKLRIQKIYPLSQAAAAHEASQTWHAAGKLILEIVKEEIR